jgi:hypothetical protein
MHTEWSAAGFLYDPTDSIAVIFFIADTHVLLEPQIYFFPYILQMQTLPTSPLHLKLT